jgi:hypothetical protein
MFSARVLPRRLYLTNYATGCAQRASKLPTSVLSKPVKPAASALCSRVVAADERPIKEVADGD